ncbi:MAG: sugar kinase [Bacteroidetes bacterium RBG_13_43_22]|nr:MAG: sugar kinase [Bacteroidetes bacterium RBG_13_43_22]
MNSNYYLGIDIGGTKCAVIAGTENMEILDKVVFPTETQRGPEYAISLLLKNASSITGKLGLQGLQSTGISCGGPLDSRKGIVQSPPNLPGWDNIPIVEMFTDALHIPAYLQNDANACALAEWKYGAGKGSDNMIFLTFGTGMGAGIIIGGKLYSGSNDLAGEVGHIRLADDGPEAYGKKGSFEGFCSGTGIALTAKRIITEKLTGGVTVPFCPDIETAGKITTKDVAEAAAAGDKTALEIFEFSGKQLGKGLSILIDILNPQIIVIGSIYARCRQFIEPACMEIIEQEALEPARSVCRVVPAALGEQVGDYASLSVAIIGQTGNL